MNESSLQMNGVGFPPLSLRDVHEQLSPVVKCDTRRTINGELIDLVPDSHRKYRLQLQCQEQHAPAIAHIREGDAVTVVPVSLLWEEVQSEAAQFSTARPVGAAHAYGVTQDEQGVRRRQPLTLALEATHEVPEDFAPSGRMIIGYRPQLVMFVQHFSVQTSEWALDSPVTWRLELEEC